MSKTAQPLRVLPATDDSEAARNAEAWATRRGPRDDVDHASLSGLHEVTR